MYYFIREDGMQKTDENTFFASETEDGVCILTIDQWQNESKWKDRASASGGCAAYSGAWV